MMPKAIKHIIWDWNGTLLNDRWLCIESINSLLNSRGIPLISEDKYLNIFDFPVRDYYSRAGFDFTKEPFEKPALQFIELYHKRMFECMLQPGALHVLEKIGKSGISQSLLSASEQAILDQMTYHHQIRHHFSLVTGLNDHYANGTEELARWHVSQLPFSADAIILVGDTCHDMNVASDNKMACILLKNGHFPAHRLEGCGSELVDDLQGLLQHPWLLGSF